MIKELNKSTVKLLIEKNTIEGLDDLCSANLVANLPMFPEATNKDGFLGFATMLFTAFPDLHHKVEFQIAEDDLVTTFITVSGTHNGDFNGIAGSGNKVQFSDVVITRIEDGKVVELWAQFDALGLLGQLGVQLFG